MIPLTIALPDLANGACRQTDPEVFFPGEGVRATDAAINDAKAVCGRCDERAKCLNWAIQVDEQGVWGGTTDDERRQMRRKGKKVAKQTNEQAREDRRREVTALHAQGFSDGAIAERLNVSRSVVQGDRGALGLVDNTPDLEPRRQAVALLHARGLNDREIATKLGCSRDKVRNDRRLLDLPNNYVSKVPAA